MTTVLYGMSEIVGRLVVKKIEEEKKTSQKTGHVTRVRFFGKKINSNELADVREWRETTCGVKGQKGKM